MGQPTTTDDAVYRPLREIPIGSVVMRPVLGADGRTLLPVSTPLNERYLTVLERYGVEGIWVREPAQRAEAARPPATERDPRHLAAASAPAEPRRAETPARGETEPSQLVPGISSFRLGRVALALGAAHEKLARASSENEATLYSDVLLDAGAAVLGEVKTTWRRPFLIEKVAADQPYHLVHPIRTALLAVRLGTGLGLREVDLVRLGTAAVMMDIGMARLPGSLVDQPGALDAATRAQMQRHPLLGAQLLRRSGYDQSVWQIVLEHHESWSGDGYPQKKAGNTTYRSARVLNLAMAYVAMISDRPHRPAYLPHEAIEYLLGYAGDQFDPALVEKMIGTIPPYPAGARVRLDGGVPATVIDPQIGQLARPIVRLDDGTIVDMASPGHLNRFVTGVLGVAEDPVARGAAASR
jgi:HD-GYP domain-containing protein (c-di-GMP phosphodiesterase class II)